MNLIINGVLCVMDGFISEIWEWAKAGDAWSAVTPIICFLVVRAFVEHFLSPVLRSLSRFVCRPIDKLSTEKPGSPSPPTTNTPLDSPTPSP